MDRVRGRRYDDSPKLNKKKVVATIIALIVFVMIVISLKNILNPNEKNKEMTSLTKYKTVYEDGKWGVIDTKGNVIIKLEYDEMIVIPNEDEDIFICTYDIDYNNETYKTKVLDEKGNEIFEDYENIEVLENSNDSIIWYEENVLKFSENGKYGLINLKGKEVLKPEYDNIYALSGTESCLILEKDGKKGLFNTHLEEIIIVTEYADIISFSEDYEYGYIVKNFENKYGVISSDKSKILNCKYDEIKKVTGNNYYVVVENGTLEIVNSSENVVLNTGFETVEGIEVDNFIITQNGKYGVINKDGNVIINPEYEMIKFSTSDYFIAQKNQKYGIIKNDNTSVIGFEYTMINYIKSADFFKAERENYTTDVFDRNFNKVLSEVIISELNIEDGYLRVRQNNEYKYYNFKFEEKSNKEVLPRNTLFLVKENGKFGYDNKNGERIVDCIYDDAKEQNEFGYCAVNKGGLWGVLKSDGTVIMEPNRNLDEYLYIDFISEWNRYTDLKLDIYTK